MSKVQSIRAAAGLLAGLSLIVNGPVRADSPASDSRALTPLPISLPAPGYADLVDLLEPAPLVLVAQIRKVAAVEPARAHGVQAGWARIYVEAKPLSALRGTVPSAQSVSYLADVPLTAKGKLPALSKRAVLLVVRPVADHPEMVQLVAPDAQLDWNPALAARVQTVLVALQAADAPGAVTRVREAIYVPGTLVGEGETQIFLATANGSPASISVLHQPGKPATWSVSFSEVVDASGLPPARDTLTWYRLACFLPRDLPQGSNVSETPEDKAQAVADYKFVLAGLGACGRTR